MLTSDRYENKAMKPEHASSDLISFARSDFVMLNTLHEEITTLWGMALKGSNEEDAERARLAAQGAFALLERISERLAVNSEAAQGKRL